MGEWLSVLGQSRARCHIFSMELSLKFDQIFWSVYIIYICTSRHEQGWGIDWNILCSSNCGLDVDTELEAQLEE
jgi:hypothetical protein